MTLSKTFVEGVRVISGRMYAGMHGLGERGGYAALTRSLNFRAAVGFGTSGYTALVVSVGWGGFFQFILPFGTPILTKTAAATAVA